MTRARLCAAAAVAAVLILLPDPSHAGVAGALARTLDAGGGSSAAASPAAATAQSPEVAFEPELGLPVAGLENRGPFVIGSSPQEAAGEVWAYGTLGNVPAIVGGVPYAKQLALLEHSSADVGWEVVPLFAQSSDEPLDAKGSGEIPSSLGPLGGRTTAAGGVVLLSESAIVARNPGGQAHAVPPPPERGSSAALLGEGESLSPSKPPEDELTAFAATEESTPGEAPRTGVLIAPYRVDGAEQKPPELKPAVLHYDGSKWTREPLSGESIEKPNFTAEALACGGTSSAPRASSPANCWLLAAYNTERAFRETNRLALFRRAPATVTKQNPSGYSWVETAIANDPQPLLGEAGTSPGQSLTVSALGHEGAGAQMLTVTSQGVWVDFQAKLGFHEAADITKLLQAPGTPTAPAEMLGSWCYPSAPVCSQSQPLGEPFPENYESFAWPGVATGAPGADLGTRIVTGLAHGARLELSEGKFVYEIGAGGEVGGSGSDGGAAFEAPQEGWLGLGKFDSNAPDGEGEASLLRATTQPRGDQLQEMPVPFRHPLLALAQAPGSTPGDPDAEAIAVGVEGEVGRYTPGQGWRPEALYDSSGKAVPATLRGVSWPEPDRAYAVGDNGAMWLWRAETGLWEPDPGEELGFVDNLTAIAFSPNEPDIGYAVGKDGVILRYGKSWEREALPPELENANFTSIAFAGSEALASYRVIKIPEGASGNTGASESGGIAVKEGKGPWHVDPSPLAQGSVFSKVAGLPDGGAVAAGPGLVIERESETAPWRYAPEPLPEARNISALGAFRDASGTLRALVSIDLNERLDPDAPGGEPLAERPWAEDLPQPSEPGEPPLLTPPDPLPDSGYLLKETATGWEDMEHMALEAPRSGNLPVRPDPVLSLSVSPNGETGLAVGGQTYDFRGEGPQPDYETAAAMRFGAGATASDDDTPSEVPTQPGAATFAVAGQAACVGQCADFASESVGPDVSLTHALQTAQQVAVNASGGLRGFLYTGGVPPQQEGAYVPPTKSESERELAHFESLLQDGGALPVLAAPSPGESGTGYHSFTSTGASGPVAVIVLDYSTGALGPTQEAWLRTELQAAKSNRTPAIVMGNAALGFTLPKEYGFVPVPQASDAQAVSAILIEGGASAYLFDYPDANVQSQVSSGAGEPIPAFGTGTFGYNSPPASFQTDSLSSSGFLLVEVETAKRNAKTNVAPVHARVEPNIAQLALDATSGVLLRRSQVALFEALARRPAQGLGFSPVGPNGSANIYGSDPYDPIPFDCLGANCSDQVPSDYSFSSSNPDIGNFVAHDPASANPRQVLLGANRLPVPDPQSGLFCAFNSGTTTVSITTGGLTYSEPVTILAGSVEYPCGTVPLKNPPLLQAPASTNFALAEPAPASEPPPASPQVKALAPPPPPAPVVHPKPVHHPRPPAPLLPFLPAVAGIAALRPAILPPPPATAQPTPPSGTSSAQVYQSAVAPESEREEQEAIDMVHNMAAYSPQSSGRPVPSYLPAVILLFAFAGAGLYDVRRRQRPRLARTGEDRDLRPGR